MTTTTQSQPIHRMPLASLGANQLNLQGKRVHLFKGESSQPAKRAKLDRKNRSSVEYAQALKTRLKFALYKVKTNQHSKPITELDSPFTQQVANAKYQREHHQNVLASSTPVFQRSVTNKKSASFLDYIVQQRKEQPNKMLPPTLQLPTPNSSANMSASSPSKFSQAGRLKMKPVAKFTLPPIPNLANNNTGHLALPSISDLVRNSPNATVLQDSSELVTPVRKPARGGLQPHNDTTLDQDETQLMSSPSRLLSTPSSIGAAKCLLQLALR